MKTFFIETYGCPLNEAESNALKLTLSSSGYSEAKEEKEADIIILNTCSVRQSAESRIYGQLGHLSALKKEKDFFLILTGCMADRLGDKLKSSNSVIDYVLPNNNKLDILSLLDGEEIRQKEYEFQKSYNISSAESAYVPISNGCNNFCSYCIVPYVRGREVSRGAEDIISEIISLDKNGVREVTLLGQNVNSYKGTYQKKEIDFPTLLELIVPHLDNIVYLRFDSPHPKDFSERLIDVIAKEERISSHIHLPLQSGSTRILRLMNRKNTREEAFFLIDKMRTRIKDVSFSTDIITGFPGESEDEFKETLTLMDYLNPSEAFMYYYNPIEGTRAYSMDGQIDENEKKRRLQILINEQLERQKRIKESKGQFVDSVVMIGISKDDKERVLCRNIDNEYFSILPKGKRKVGDILKIKVECVSGNTYRGYEIE